MAHATDEARPPIGWRRAILTAAIIVIAAGAALVYGVDAILTKVHGMGRGGRVGIATAAFVLGFSACAGALRLLQRRNMI